MKVRKISLSKQMMLIFTILILVGDLLIGVVVYNRMQALFMEKVQENAINLAQCAAASVDAKAFSNIVADGDEESYDIVHEQLTRFLENSTLKYVYSFSKNDAGKIIFVVDADPEEPAEVGELYDEELEGVDIAFCGKAAVDDKPSSDEWGKYVSAYCPIFDGKTVVGIVGVDVDYTGIQHSINKLLIIIFLICVTVFVMLFVALLVISRKMNTGFNTLNNKINELADGSGDLNKKISIASGDEFEVIGESINAFILQLQNLVKQVVSSSNGSANSIRSINDNTLTISANMEECSASTESVSEQLSITANNIEILAKNVEEADDKIAQASERARVAAETAIAHRIASEEQIQNLQKDIVNVMKQAEAVSQVQKINEEIMSIVNETRILSLNAQLEAARAGDAGKGFDVVAKEVAALSEEISEAVVRIGDINANVINAMNQMVTYLENMNKFLNASVTQDYITFAEIGDDYGKTTELMQQCMQALRVQSSEIALTVVGVSNSIQDISKVVSDSAGQIEELCGSTVEISDEINNLLEIPIMKL